MASETTITDDLYAMRERALNCLYVVQTFIADGPRGWPPKRRGLEPADAAITRFADKLERQVDRVDDDAAEWRHKFDSALLDLIREANAGKLAVIGHRAYATAHEAAADLAERYGGNLFTNDMQEGGDADWCERAVNLLRQAPPLDHLEAAIMQECAATVRYAESTPTPKPAAERITVDLDHRTVTLDGEQFAVSDEGAALVHHLIAGRGGWVSGATMSGTAPRVGRAGRVRGNLPEPIRLLIESKHGGGFRLTLNG